MSSAQHDELAQLFARQMSVSQAYQASILSQKVTEEPIAAPAVRRGALPIDFASCHYTGTAYLRSDVVSEPSYSPPPPYQEVFMGDEIGDILRRHSINPQSLSPNQIRLFQHADYEQKLRLLELWRISPPTPPHEPPHMSWQHDTSMEKEESFAKARYEQQYKSQSPLQPIGLVVIPSQEMVSDVAPVHFIDAEPYIAEGYHTANTFPTHMEPVYGANQQLWNPATQSTPPTQIQRIEEHYGMTQQIRNHADWECMNEAIARERFSGYDQTMDEEML